MERSSKRRRQGLVGLLIGGLGICGAVTLGRAGPEPVALAKAPDATTKATVQAAYGKLPLHFEANWGQTDSRVQFLARGPGATLFLTATEAVLVFRTPPHPAPLPRGERDGKRGGEPEQARGAVVRMQLVGANPQPRVEGREALPGKVNYLRGSDRSRWRTGIPTYAKVAYEGVYPGVDVVWYGTQGQVEYDFLVAPGADPSRITLAFEGVAHVELDAQGDLLLQTTGGTLRLQKPRLYQDINGVRQPISGAYVLNSQSAIANLQSQIFNPPPWAFKWVRMIEADPW